jgi:uncharacterized membrane protein YhaH (DUF805 family)|tara:strand:- start:63 stop:476 length:414 start_codon:yes stop_codon:yes gene_type:complete
MVSFTESIGTCFSKYGVASGRASRSEYWWFQLFLLIIGTVGGIADIIIFETIYGEKGPINIVLMLATILPSICVAVRRLHDVNRSGWWMFIALTCVGIIPLLIWACSKGTDGSNDYGEDPFQVTTWTRDGGFTVTRR